jgi:hypothetical protein
MWMGPSTPATSQRGRTVTGSEDKEYREGYKEQDCI